MNKIKLVVPALLLLALPLSVSAHEHDTFIINGATYNFVVGSLNEPIAVDDKTGLDLTVTKGSAAMKMSADGDMDEPAAASPVTGLDKTLKVEMIAGDQKKTMDISPAWGAPGKYETVFYPTISTTFSYRIFGTIDNTPVDLTFTCLPEGTPRAVDDHNAMKLSDAVTRTIHGGAFGCPVNKEDLGFPEKSTSVASAASFAQGASSKSNIALGLGAAALALALAGWMRRRA